MKPGEPGADRGDEGQRLSRDAGDEEGDQRHRDPAPGGLRQRRQASKRGVSGGDVGQPDHLRADPFAVHEAKLPQAGEEEARAGKEAAARTERMKQRTPRVDWAELLRRTLDFDVFACVRCGGRRRVLAYVKGARGVRAILKHLGLRTASAHLGCWLGRSPRGWRPRSPWRSAPRQK